MTTEIKHLRSLIGDSLEAKLARMDDLEHVYPRLRRVVMRANRGIRFREGHGLSHLVVGDGRVEIGTYAPGYFKLLRLSGERLAEVVREWIIEGKS